MISVTLATAEFVAKGKSAQLVYSEQSIYFDTPFAPASKGPASRKQGTEQLLEQLRARSKLAGDALSPGPGERRVRARGRPSDPRMASYIARLDEMNLLAEGSPGFVWRYLTDSRDPAQREFADTRSCSTCRCGSRSRRSTRTRTGRRTPRCTRHAGSGSSRQGGRRRPRARDVVDPAR